MDENLIDGSTYYYHPSTRQRVAFQGLDGQPDFLVEPKPTLTPREVVQTFYADTGIGTKHWNFKRDSGAVRWLVQRLGLDMALFAIDALVDDYRDNPTGYPSPPELVNAGNFTHQAETRLGVVQSVAEQYGLRAG